MKKRTKILTLASVVVFIVIMGFMTLCGLAQFNIIDTWWAGAYGFSVLCAFFITIMAVTCPYGLDDDQRGI